MTLRLFDSATRQVRPFVPLVPGQVGIYVCGATPQASPHIGHLRAGVAFDVVRRWLERSGHRVTLVRNVTDIDDKILAKSAEAGRPWWAHAYLYENEFSRAYATLNVPPPTYEPRATGHMIEMVELIERLLEAGHAYTVGDCADVYFDVRSFPAYGALTNQGLDELDQGEDDAVPGRKRDPRDFALWKSPKPGDPDTAGWPAPWGRGRPGWHIECSAMATRYLGAEFDIHGGGLDLRFPHHENEQAQSRAAGDGFARYWMHNAWVVQAGEKMSKSLGNVLALDVLLEQARPAVIRYVLTAAHYRSNIEFGPESLVEAAAAYDRIEGFVLRADEFTSGAVAGADLEKAALPEAFSVAMDDDFGVPAALGVVFETVRAGNSALAENDAARVLDAGVAVRAMTDVLGLDPLDPRWAAGSDAADPARAALDALVAGELQARAEARSARDFATADAIRARLTAAGIDVEDTPSGARWSLATAVTTPTGGSPAEEN